MGVILPCWWVWVDLCKGLIMITLKDAGGTTATDAATALSLGDAGLHADNFILL
ncbi:MAG: hypothetical protein H0A76_06585 [Candidatus Thiodubiliella endoseptemdiera]|uniref:Uncharacterized protein n=1 Tax=Candidatus Thiodubiliella endoseptemdiera TaxID=2738886 RepID=A0A853F234_9GAMM|nr:hypothetical protein [Candidatus Thiodubiliella endoseptemdiera]